jgi:hypothetical protein
MTGGLALRTLPGAPSRWRLSRTICGTDPRGRVVARLLPAPHLAIDTCSSEAFCSCRVQKEMVDSQPCIPAPCVSEVIPKRVDSLVRMQLTDCIHPTQLDETAKGVTHLRSEERVIQPALWFINIQVSRHDVEVAGPSTTGASLARSSAA